MSSMARYYARSIQCLFLACAFCIGNSSAKDSDLPDFLSAIENSEYFSPKEKSLTRQIIENANAEDSFLEAVLSSNLISDKEKEIAKSYFQENKKPKQIRYKEPSEPSKIEVLAPPMRFHADLDLRIRSVDTAKDVSNYFQRDNVDLDPGVTQIIKGSIRYQAEGEENPSLWGQVDLDIQSLDQEQDVINALLVKKGSTLKVGTFLSQDFSEFGLRNTELSGAQFQLRKRKWVLDYIRGETVEDYVASLDSLVLGGGILKREIGHGGRDFLGLSFYDHDRFHYAGFLGQGYFLDEALRFYGEYMHRDSGIVGNTGSAYEFEMDFQNNRVLLLNEFQKISANFSSHLNPEFSQFGNVLSERNRQEHGFTYRFDPFVSSSLVLTRRSNLFVDGTPEVTLADVTLALLTQRPSRPKYMVVVKQQEKTDDLNLSFDERRRIFLAQTTFKGGDIITTFDVAQTDFENFRDPAESYLLNALTIDVSRPFFQKLWIRERLGLLDQNYDDGSKDSESQTHQLEVKYKLDSRNTLRGLQNYRRVARKVGPNKYKMIYGLEAKHRRSEDLEYVLRLDSFNNNEFGRGYDANRVSLGANLSF